MSTLNEARHRAHIAELALSRAISTLIQAQVSLIEAEVSDLPPDRRIDWALREWAANRSEKSGGMLNSSNIVEAATRYALSHPNTQFRLREQKSGGGL